MSDYQRPHRDRDRFYVQRDKHAVFQRLSQDDGAPFRTMKDVWILAAALGYRAKRRSPLRGGTQHVGFWHYLSLQEDVALLHAMSIAETGDVLVLGDRGEVIKIAEEYANAGIDILLEAERHDREGSLRSIGAMVVETARQAAGSSLIADHDSGDQDRSIEGLLQRGESQTLEFKSSARWNSHSRSRDRALEEEILHAIVAFLNSGNGGSLLIGIDDSGRSVGLTGDYGLLGRRQNRDGFETWLLDMLEGKMGRSALAGLSVTFPLVDKNEICRVDVEASPSPVFVDGDPWFYLRLGNSTRRLSAEDMIKYRSQRWPSLKT